MSREAIKDIILRERLMAIIRTKEPGEVSMILEGLLSGEIKVLEITSNTPGFEDLIRESRKRHPEALIGAGTIRNTSIAQKALEAGAQFLVSPNTQTELVQVAHEHHVPIVMGALTPTEVSDAVEAGADIIKLFPAANFGSNYLKAIKGPFDQVSFFAVGGIHLDNMWEWLEAGAVGLGLGAVLTDFEKDKFNKENIENRARTFVKKINTYYARP
ncbi:bifunctional 4-hydroxy-2-oxoglutarate aldolase/2-dehydro-3-deoxy-phosphogluconate aldolase [Echinicola marina]|uniref:bifunctional 4-hydroxy-2-oxoglutarate aldolase/2-dehydro-3-deoxy-phosphogluconate aldolase n=1 Tax=Echinicola marina TaxID=2859768 RepID=UPI001CF6CB32|nr:bifunctional 4-hydroxy-2-oxoglutarate aldolase/2-dehydro-3-deoxy-phosphogluconate aldolase [Echinicola marina]UCS91741.1 bifunctional 4-hydroxy-2-oxoglutarate aldolase/2-dehydro-3-deoxy-phosphogluconate aldolase [Echinicola marina]